MTLRRVLAVVAAVVSLLLGVGVMSASAATQGEAKVVNSGMLAASSHNYDVPRQPLARTHVTLSQAKQVGEAAQGEIATRRDRQASWPTRFAAELVEALAAACSGLVVKRRGSR
jgi:hypothetical protein